MDSALVMVFGTVGLLLLLIGTAIQFRNRSPYSNVPIDEESRNRFGVGAWLAAAGALGLLASTLGAAWR